jgi:hypothetical protein
VLDSIASPVQNTVLIPPGRVRPGRYPAAVVTLSIRICAASGMHSSSSEISSNEIPLSFTQDPPTALANDKPPILSKPVQKCPGALFFDR